MTRPVTRLAAVRLARSVAPPADSSTRSAPVPPVSRSTSAARSAARESRTWSAPSARTVSCLPGEAVAITIAPQCLAIFTAAWPVPPAAAWISTVCPAAMRPRGRSAARAVGQFTSRPIASCSAQPVGTGITAIAGSVVYSAKAPHPMPAPITRAPGSRPVTASPLATISPAASKPARYGGCGPPGNAPWACEMSPKLTPAAVTRIRTSPRPGAGTGTSVISRRSCGPFRDVCCRARMVAGMLTAIGVPFLGWRDRGRPTFNQADPARAEKESLGGDRGLLWPLGRLPRRQLSSGEGIPVHVIERGNHEIGAGRRQQVGVVGPGDAERGHAAGLRGLHAGGRVLDHHRVAWLDAEFMRGGQEDLGVWLAAGEIAPRDIHVEVVQQRLPGLQR